MDYEVFMQLLDLEDAEDRGMAEGFEHVTCRSGCAPDCGVPLFHDPEYMAAYNEGFDYGAWNL